MTHLSLTFFGSFQATLGEESITYFRSSKVQGLLAYLVLTNAQPHARDALAALLWPNEAESSAKKNLRQSLYQLRLLLGDTDTPSEPHLLVTRSTVQLNPAGDHTVDVADFRTHLDNGKLRQAVDLYRDELLPGFSCDSIPFDEWLHQERERLHRLVLGALFELTARNLAQANYSAARDLAQRQLALEPWREEAHRQLMQAFALLGEHSAALAQYEICCATLKKELAVKPSPETEALGARLRSRRNRRDGAVRRTLPPERRRLTTPFVGRKREHEALATAYRQACSGGARVVVLTGEAGIGKTRLAQHFLDWAAAQGADVLQGQAFATSGRLSYHPLTQALRQRLERENAPEDLLSDLWLTQLTRILPELRDRYPDLPQPTQEEATARRHLFEAIARLGQALAERAPLILFLDDWHWADMASLDVLHYATMRWSEEQAPILVLLTLRREALAESPSLQSWLTDLKHDTAYLRLDLATLTAGEIEELMRALLAPHEEQTSGSPIAAEKRSSLTRFSRRLYEETEGHPFFLVETVKALVEGELFQPVPGSHAWRVNWAKWDEELSEAGLPVVPAVRESMKRWLERISTPAGELLAAAAILGQDASFDRLCQVSGLAENAALIALDELLARQLLVEAGEDPPKPGQEVAYGFAHQKLADVVYAEAGSARRRILHRRAFEALQAIAAPAAELAHHALHAGLWAETIRYSIHAGHGAMDLFAVGVAIAHFETAWQAAEQTGWSTAVSGADRQDLYTGLGRAYELNESWSQAEKVYQDMISYARTLGAAVVECLGLNRLATVYIHGFKDPEQAIALLEQARAVAEQSGDRRGMAETDWNLSVAARMVQDIHTARQRGEQALAVARQLGHSQLLGRCLNSLAYIYAYLRQWKKVEHYADEGRALYEAAGNRILEADCQRLVGWAQMYVGRPEESLLTLQDTFAFSKQIGNLWGEAECAYRLAGAQLELGQYGHAVRLARQAVQQASEVGMPTMVLLARTTLGAVQRTVMALEAARETLLAVLEELVAPADHELAGFGDWVLAELSAVDALAGEWGDAHEYARQALHARGKASLQSIALTGWLETEALLRGGDGDLARAEVERLSKMLQDNRRYRLPLMRSRAVLAQWDGDLELAIGHLQAALAVAREIGLPGEAWSILGALGDLYVKLGDPEEARRMYQQSAAIIQRLAATIEEEEMRAGYLAAGPVQAVLAAIGES